MVNGQPTYVHGFYRLKLKEILEICISEKIDPAFISDGMPHAVRESAVFVIRTSPNITFSDLTADDNGSYDGHFSPSDLIYVNIDENRNIIDHHTLKNDEQIPSPEKLYCMSRQYSHKGTTKEFSRTTRSSKEHHGSPCDRSVKSGGPLYCHKLRSNQAHRTKYLLQDVGAISTIEV